MARNRKPKWAVSVVEAMQKSCPSNCPFRSDGIMRDSTGKVIGRYSCETYCKFKRKIK